MELSTCKKKDYQKCYKKRVLKKSVKHFKSILNKIRNLKRILNKFSLKKIKWKKKKKKR